MKPRPLTLIGSVVALALAGIITGCASPDPSDTAKLEARASVSRAAAEKTALSANPGAVIKSGGIEDEGGKVIWSFGLTTPGSSIVTDVKVDANTGALIATPPAPAPAPAPAMNAEISNAAEAGAQAIAKGGSPADVKASAAAAEAKIKAATAEAAAKINALGAAATARIDAAVADAEAKRKADAEAEKKAAADAAAASAASKSKPATPADAKPAAVSAPVDKAAADRAAADKAAADKAAADAKLKVVAEGEIPVIQGLLKRYSDAWAHHDTETIVKLYPAITPQRADLSSAFDKFQSSAYSLDKCVFSQTGRSAVAECTETWSNVGKDTKDTGKGQRQQRYTLEKQAGGFWVIKAVK